MTQVIRMKWFHLIISFFFLAALCVVMMSSANAETQNAMWFMDDLNFTQLPGGDYSHAGTLNFDVKGINNPNIHAPFDCEIVEIFPGESAANTVIIQSVQPVRYANGTVDYMSMAIGHDNNISDCYVGRRLNQGEVYLQNGNYGNADGVHSHVTVIAGKYTDHPGWVHVVAYDTWTFSNAIHPVDAFFISTSTHVYNTMGLTFQYEGSIGQPMTQGYDRAIADGDYLIVTAASTDKSSFYYLDIQGTDVPAASGTNVALSGPYVDVPAHEIWTVTYGEGFGFYNIKQKGTNISLTVQDGSLYAGTNVCASTHTASSPQHWAISRSYNGYTIQSECNGFALDIKGASISKGSNIQVFTPNGGSNQSWLFIPYQPTQPLSEGRYILVSSADEGKIVDVLGNTASVSEGTALQINSDSVQNRYNSFDFQKLSNGYYTITHAGSGKALAVYGGVPDKDARITLRTPNNSTSQQWRVKSEGNGTYSLTVRSSGHYMNHGSTDNGTPIVQWYYNGLTTQKWYLVKAEYTVSYDLNGGADMLNSQTKYYKNDLILSNVEPQRSGFAFTGWNTRSDGSGTAYSSGAAYTLDADMTLYAQWQPMVRLVLPADLVTIGQEAFADVGAYIIVVPDGCVTIEKRAFADNDKLVQIVIPSTVENIAFDAFENCNGLTIYAPAGSAAIRMAQELGIPYRIIGT